MLSLSIQKKIRPLNAEIQSCTARKNRNRRCSPTRLKRLATPNLLRVLLTFDAHFHHLNIFQIENFLKIIYEKSYQTPREFIKSLRNKSKSFRRGKFCKRKLRGLEGFDVLELDENDEWKSDEQCYSTIDFYPRNDQEEKEHEKMESDLKIMQLKIESPEQKNRDSEISFLRPSQIYIAKSECEKIFKKLEVFHEQKMAKTVKKDGSDDDDKGKRGNKKRKNQDNPDDDEKKTRKSGSRKIEDEEEEDEEDDEDEEIEGDTDICAKLVKKDPEWSVEWVE